MPLKIVSETLLNTSLTTSILSPSLAQPGPHSKMKCFVKAVSMLGAGGWVPFESNIQAGVDFHFPVQSQKTEVAGLPMGQKNATP